MEIKDECYNNIKLHTTNLQNIENDGNIQVIQTLKDSQAKWSFSAWKKSAKMTAHNQKQFGSKILDNPRKVTNRKQEHVENHQIYSQSSCAISVSG